jgi:hypothetical protein
MSKVYTYSDARQNFATILDEALRDGLVKVRRKDGQVFIIRPETKIVSPLAVEGVDLGVTTDEIIEFVRESRRV